jgi:lipoprotein-anchoring transpeptidase ErfK/SrfK
LVRETEVMVIEPTAPPEGVGEGDRWIDVDLGRQAVVAYDWKQPRYVTLVSTGRTKTPSPEQSYLTPKGLHRIRGKHLTSTMDNDEPGEPPYSLEDVPYVMYFRGAYAFHSAFWHDRFGRPRSHGCINMAPYDAKWLFNWAGPDLPDTWHGGMATEDNPGTWVHVHGETP